MCGFFMGTGFYDQIIFDEHLFQSYLCMNEKYCQIYCRPDASDDCDKAVSGRGVIAKHT